MSEDLTKRFPKNDSDKLNLILTIVQNLEGRLQALEKRVDDIDVRLQSVEARVNGVASRLETLEQKVDERLYDTRPIWHRVVADIAQLQTGQDALRQQILELHGTAREINRDQIVINEATRKIQMDFHTINERLHKLELSRSPQNSST